MAVGVVAVATRRARTRPAKLQPPPTHPRLRALGNTTTEPLPHTTTPSSAGQHHHRTSTPHSHAFERWTTPPPNHYPTTAISLGRTLDRSDGLDLPCERSDGSGVAVTRRRVVRERLHINGQLGRARLAWIVRITGFTPRQYDKFHTACCHAWAVLSLSRHIAQA